MRFFLSSGPVVQSEKLWFTANGHISLWVEHTAQMVAPRQLSRDAQHRKALLRNLVTALFEHESITTTHAKAKEAQRLADHLISLTKKEDQQRAKSLVASDVFKHGEVLPKLFGELKERYATRVGGYTRVLKLEPRLSDNAPQSILELVDGTREMKFWITARVVARLQQQGLEVDPLTQHNVEKLIKYRKNGQEEFDSLVERLKTVFYKDSDKLMDNMPSTVLIAPTEPKIKENVKVVPRPSRE